MTDPPVHFRPAAHRRSARALTVIGLVLYAPVCAGFLLHTSPASAGLRVFGKYSLPYAVLLVLLLAPLAGIEWIATRLTRPIVLPRPDGPPLRLGGWRKARFGCSAALLGLALAALLLEAVAAVPRVLRPPPADRRPTDRQPFFEAWPGGSRSQTNRWAWLGPEVAIAPPPGAFRVFALGGSTTFLYHSVPHRLNFTARLNRSLAAARPGRPVAVVNAACSGHSSFQSLMKYALLIREFRPDVVLVMHGVNDAEEWKTALAPPAWRRPYERDYSHEARWSLGVLLRESGLGHPPAPIWSETAAGRAVGRPLGRVLFSDLRRGPRIADEERLRIIMAEMARGLEPMRRNLRTLVHLGRGDGVRVVILSQPTMYRPGAADRAVFNYHTPEEADWPVWAGRPDLFRVAWDRTMRAYNDASRGTAADLGTPFVDLEAAVPAEWRNFHPDRTRLDGVHMSADGCALAAEALRRALLPLVPDAP